jgi:hypothetical protein
MRRVAWIGIQGRGRRFWPATHSTKKVNSCEFCTGTINRYDVWYGFSKLIGERRVITSTTSHGSRRSITDGNG